MSWALHLTHDTILNSFRVSYRLVRDRRSPMPSGLFQHVTGEMESWCTSHLGPKATVEGLGVLRWLSDCGPGRWLHRYTQLCFYFTTEADALLFYLRFHNWSE